MRTALAVAGLLLLPTAAEARPCTAAHHCSRTVIATSHLRAWRTPEQIGRNASVQARVVARGHRLRWVVDGDTVYFRGHGALVTARARRERAPLSWQYVARKRLRLRLVYWTE